MALSKEEKEQLERLSAKAKEPDGPRGDVHFTLDLSSDSAWERAVKLGIIPSDDPPPDDKRDDPGDDGPKRRGFFGDQ